MKKVLVGLLIIGLVVGGYVCYKKFTGEHCYVQIIEAGKIGESKGTAGRTYKDYTYSLTGYDKRGKSQNFKLIESRQLRKGAYLDVRYDAKRGVLSWKEIRKSDVPKKALEHFE